MLAAVGSSMCRNASVSVQLRPPGAGATAVLPAPVGGCRPGDMVYGEPVPVPLPTPVVNRWPGIGCESGEMLPLLVTFLVVDLGGVSSSAPSKVECCAEISGPGAMRG